MPIAQYYGVCADRRTPYRIYGGLQDNGSWGGPSRTDNPAGILNADWFRILAYDGFYCQAPRDDPFTVYAEGQFGLLHRINLRTRQAIPIHPRARRGTSAFRFNWSTPLAISAHDAKTLYYGGNYLFKSTDRGQSWRIISPDLTRGQPGPYAHTGHTLTTIGESPRKAGVLYAGSDDGKVHVTRDDGRTWLDLSARLPGVPAEALDHAGGMLAARRRNRLAEPQPASARRPGPLPVPHR